MLDKKLIYYGSVENTSDISVGCTFEEIIDWLKVQTSIQFDTETNMCKSIVDRVLRVIQLGSTTEYLSYVIQWSYLTDQQKLKLLTELYEANVNRNVIFIIQNASFDYQVLKRYGVTLENVWDTMIMEQEIYNGYGYDLSFFSLAEILLRRFGIDMSKELQASFDDDILTDDQIRYAGMDTIYLKDILMEQYNELREDDNLQIATHPEYSDNKAVLAFADMEYNGMWLDKDMWLSNIDKAEPIRKEAKAKLDTMILTKLYDFCSNLDVKHKIGNATVATKAILTEDTLLINWNSSSQALAAYQLVFPDLNGMSQLALKKYLAANCPELAEVKPTSKKFMENIAFSGNKFDIIKGALCNGAEAVGQVFIDNFKDKLTEMGYFYKKNSIMINWNSPQVKLSIFQQFDPTIENTRAETVEAREHIPFFATFQDYQHANSLVSKYGHKFIDEHVDADGRVRTRFNIVLATGRVSSSKPNLQNIPKNKLPEGRKGDYRNCFGHQDPDWVCIGSDYSSQELFILAHLSQDPVLLNAIRLGQDLHSVGAEIMYGDTWLHAAERDCAFYAKRDDGTFAKKQCSCAGHKDLRGKVKTLNFGTIYGMTPEGLAAKLDCTVEAATKLQKLYFESFPTIDVILNSFAAYGLQNGYIRTGGVTNAKRYFPYWKPEGLARGMVNSITRACFNTPIQGLAASQSKIACILFRKHSRKFGSNCLLVSQLHDEVFVQCHKSIQNGVADLLQWCMEEAGRITMGVDILKAEPEITQRWYSDLS